jgi:hypothetical protein
MKKTFTYLIAMTLIIGVSGATATAQDQNRHVVVKTASGEVASFSVANIKRQYIQDGKWVFELKETSQTYSYALTEVLPFTTAVRAGNGTAIQPAPVVATWQVYDGGASLVISKPGGAIGHYAVYTVAGQLVKGGYEAGAEVAVPANRGVYVVRVGDDSRKIIKK